MEIPLEKKEENPIIAWEEIAHTLADMGKTYTATIPQVAKIDNY
nr:hypothetical protein [uncultured Flavobacterium sp.]